MNDSNHTTTATLTELAERTANQLPGGCNGAGEPSRRAAKIVNGHRVTVWVFGYGQTRTIFEVDNSTQPLNLEEAAEAVA